MATHTILPQAPPTPASSTADEVEALVFALFADTYGLCLDEAGPLAEAQLPELLDYARDWDSHAAVAGNPTVQ